MKSYTDVKWLWFVLILLALTAAFAFQGSRGLYDTTEGRYAECAREMIETGNYLEPTLSYRPHWTKPPLTYWAIAGGMELLGRNEWGVRLYNSVAFLLTVLAVVHLGTALWDRKAGLVAGLIYSTSLFPVIAANAVSTDTLLTLWETAAVLSYIKACRNRSTAREKLWVLAMWAFLGLGFFTKGPISLLPLIPILVRHLQNNKPVRVFEPWGLLVFVLIGFSWYLACAWHHQGLLSYWLGHEVVDRVALPDAHNPRWYKSVLTFLLSIGFGSGLWLYFGIKAVWRTRTAEAGRLWRYLTSGNRSFLLVWLAVPLLFFCLLPRPLTLYVLPLFVPITLAIARGICKFWQSPRILRSVVVLAVISAVLAVGVKAVASVYPSSKDMKALYQLCRELKKDQTSVVYDFEGSKLYGLQFYLDGKLARLSISGHGPRVDASLAGAIREARTQPTPTSIVLICSHDRASQLDRVLEDLGVSFQHLEDRYWVLYLVTTSQAVYAGDG